MTQNQAFEELLRAGKIRNDKDIDLIEKVLARSYRDAYKSAKQELANLYARLGDKLSLPEAQKYKRLEYVLAKIKKEYFKLTGKSLGIAEGSSEQSINNGFWNYAYSMDSATGVALTWGVLPVDAIRKSVFSENQTLNIIKTFKKNRDQELYKIQGVITRALSTGEPFLLAANRMKDAYNGGLFDAMRVIRTEGMRNYNEGHLIAHEKAKALGINVRKRWYASKDDRTRIAHAILDGQYEDKDGYFTVDGYKAKAPGLFGVAELDINCRCTIIEEIEGLPQEIMRVKGDDPEEEVQEYQTYEEWATPRGWTREGGWPKKAK